MTPTTEPIKNDSLLNVESDDMVFTEDEASLDAFNDYDLSTISESDFLGMYMEENSQYELLTADEEIELAKEIEAGKLAANRLENVSITEPERKWLLKIKEVGLTARTRLIQANSRLVISFAKKYRGQGLEFMDLIQEGNVGLLTAVDRFDYRLGNRFSTYATWWIRQGVTRALANDSREIRIPAHLHTRIRKINHLQREWEQENNTLPSSEEIAAALEMPVGRVRWLMEITRPLLHLEQMVGEEPDKELGELIEDTKDKAPAEIVAQNMLSEELLDMLDQLTPREANIIRLRFGLTGDEPLTFKEIGQKMGLSRERIRQLEKSALRRLRQPKLVGHLQAYLN